MKLNKVVFSILLISIIFYLMLAFGAVTGNKTYANTPVPGTLTRDIEGIDDTLYPGYKQLINELKTKHPNYVFLAYYTGLNWEEVLVTEYQGHGGSPLNLFQVGSNYNGMWQCPLCATKAYDNGSWCCASLEAVAYMMDPRNSINESDVFQFKDLEGVDVSYDDIARVVSGYGAYLNNQEAIQAIYDASVQYNINPYFLVAKIINEHGKNGSTLSNGQGYNGNYIGCYNYFNINASGNGVDKIINNGLSYAQNHGWTSIRASIFGGAAIVKESFITRYSQNTLYYQKFNVSGRSALGSHQYQQNIMAAQSQGASLKNYYSSSSTNTTATYTFIIPLYMNMPETVAPRPDPKVANTITYQNGIVQNVSDSLQIRASANGTWIGALNNNESIKIIKRGATEIGGYLWDLIVSNVNGTYGYAARYVGGDECIVADGTIGTSSSSVNQPEPPPVQEPTDTPVENTPLDTPLNGVDSSKLKVTQGFVSVTPEMSTENVKASFENAVIKDGQGNVVEAGKLGTGYSVIIGENVYKVVKKGDTNGDGNVSITDAILLLNALKGEKTLENEYKQAASVMNRENFNITDAVMLLNYLKGTAQISL